MYCVTTQLTKRSQSMRVGLDRSSTGNVQYPFSSTYRRPMASLASSRPGTTRQKMYLSFDPRTTDSLYLSNSLDKITMLSTPIAKVRNGTTCVFVCLFVRLFAHARWMLLVWHDTILFGMIRYGMIRW